MRYDGQKGAGGRRWGNRRAGRGALFCGARRDHGDRRTGGKAGRALAESLRARISPSYLGGHPLEAFLERDIIVPSPGVPWKMTQLEAARDKGVRVAGELDFAAEELQGRVIGVTGSNGKTTTVSLIGHILQTAGMDAVVGGNIGRPLLDMADESTEGQWSVLELSSFQLEAMSNFHCHIAAILNITPDHLDRHGDFDSYVAAKARILAAQNAEDVAVLNREDPVVAGLAEQVKGRTVWFPGQRALRRRRFGRPAIRSGSRGAGSAFPAACRSGRSQSAERAGRRRGCRAGRGARQRDRLWVGLVPGGRASPRAGGDDRRGGLLQRLQGDQRGRHAQGCRVVRRRAVADSGRPRQAGSDFAALEDRAEGRVRQAPADRRSGGRQDRARNRLEQSAVRTAATWNRRCAPTAPNRRSRARLCCSRPPAPASTSSTTTATGALNSSASWPSWPPNETRSKDVPRQLHYDRLLCLTILALTCFGLLMVFSVTAADGDPSFTVHRQARRRGGDRAGRHAVSDVPGLPRVAQSEGGLRGCRACAIVLLTVAFLFGGGATTGRWLSLGFFSFQPSEVAKLAVISFLAYYLETHGDKIDSIRSMAGGGIVLAAFCASDLRRARPGHCGGDRRWWRRRCCGRLGCTCAGSSVGIRVGARLAYAATYRALPHAAHHDLPEPRGGSVGRGLPGDAVARSP